jgi:hypothetical protein
MANGAHQPATCESNEFITTYARGCVTRNRRKWAAAVWSARPLNTVAADGE